MKMYNRFGDYMYSTDKLKNIRKKYQLTIYDMASYLNITASFYSQLENKKRRLYYDTAVRIANVFGLKPDDIFYIDN